MLLAGANNSGKTALLSALDLVVRGAVPTMPRHAAALDRARVRARFVLSEEEQYQLLSNSDLSAEDQPEEAFRWVEWHFVEAPENALQAHELYISWREQRTVLAAQVIFIPPSGHRFVINRGLLDILSGAPWSGDSGPDSLADVHTVSEGGGVPELIGSLAGFAAPLEPLVELLTAWRQRYYHFSALRRGTTEAYPLRSDENLTPTGENLPAVLLDLQHNRFESWERVRSIIERIVPDVGVLETPTQGQQMSVAFADPHVPGYRPNIKNLGTGVEQLFMTILVGVTQPAASIVVIEEPETNLHPGAQRALLTQLREWASDRLFILSTHSPVFLDRAPLASTVFLVERAQGVSTVRPLASEPSEALAALGVRLSDVLSADRLLIVEGDPDREILTAWFPALMADPRMEVVLGHGGDLARFAEVFSTWLREVDRLDGRRVLYLRDRDEVPSTILSRLEAASEVHVLRRRELENYLLEPEAIAEALVRREVVDSGGADSMAVGKLLREGADQLLMAVVLKRVASEFVSRRLMDRQLVADLIEQGPTLDRLQQAVAKRLPSGGLLDEIATRWTAIESEFEAVWSERWRELAPGSDVLTYVWKSYGRIYNKLHDGLAIAQAMQPPEELTHVLQGFLTA